MESVPLELGSATSNTPSPELEKAIKSHVDQPDLEYGGKVQCCGKRCSCS